MSNRLFCQLLAILILMLFFLGLTSCADTQLDEVPVVPAETIESAQPYDFPDRVQLTRGLMLRQLIQQGYDSIFALGRFISPDKNALPYELYLLDAKKDQQQWWLLMSVHHRYHSVQDVYAMDPKEYALYRIDSETDRIRVDLRTGFKSSEQEPIIINLTTNGKFAVEP